MIQLDTWIDGKWDIGAVLQRLRGSSQLMRCISCSSTMAASSVQEQDLIVLGRRPQAPQQPQQQAASSAADPQQARMQAAMRTRPDGSLENVQASLSNS